jgi:hypothetical protein
MMGLRSYCLKLPKSRSPDSRGSSKVVLCRTLKHCSLKYIFFPLIYISPGFGYGQVEVPTMTGRTKETRYAFARELSHEDLADAVGSGQPSPNNLATLEP